MNSFEGDTTGTGAVPEPERLLQPVPEGQRITVMLAAFEGWNDAGEAASDALREAFDLSKEHPGVRERYGHSLFGSSTLAARKLVEAGVKFVSVFWDNYAPRLGVADYGWDTHEHNFITLRDRYLRLD